MSAKYFFRTEDNHGNPIAFDIDRVVGVGIFGTEERPFVEVTIDAGSETFRQPVNASMEDILLAISTKSVR